MAAVTQEGRALKYADASLQADKDVVMAAVTQEGWALMYADASLQADKDVVMAAVAQDAWALKYADASLQTDFEVQLVHAFRHGTATTALNAMHRLRMSSDWEEQDATLGRAVALLSCFPVSATSPSEHRQLHDVVEDMIRQAYRPGTDRDRKAFQQEGFAY